MFFSFHTKQAWIVCVFMLVLFCSCATYNKRMAVYYQQLETKQYDKAMKTLDKTAFIRRDRNRLLYLFEKGKLYHLLQQYDSSNAFLNKADNFIENTSKTAGDLLKANLINPMMKTYMGEDIERFMVHYYKGLNYSLLNLPNDAVVEARRITLANDALGDKFNNSNNRYSNDAFALNLQGMLYEAAGDVNNAFIAYRNAADVYLAAPGSYYGVTLPKQLQQDVLRTAHQLGFYAEQQQYEKLFNTSLQQTTHEGGSLILFIEKGLAPIKAEQNIFITRDAGGLNRFFYVDASGRNIDIPFNFFDYNGLSANNRRLQTFRTFRVAIPMYQVHYTNNTPVVVTANTQKIIAETAQDLNTVAVRILQERMLKEIADALARQMVKLLLQKGVEKIAEASAEKKSDTKQNESKKEKAKNAAEVAGLLTNIINTATEKADTRNWQSLPAYIQYVRIPLQKGENTINVNIRGTNHSFTVTGNGGLQFMSKAVW